jgi:hypothetical protein
MFSKVIEIPGFTRDGQSFIAAYNKVTGALVSNVCEALAAQVAVDLVGERCVGHDLERLERAPPLRNCHRAPPLRQRQPQGPYRIVGFCLRQSPRRDGLPQEKILQHKLPFPPYKRPIANAARYLSIVRLRPCFDFDHSIIGAAVRASEWIECRWPATKHDTPPIPNS